MHDTIWWVLALALALAGGIMAAVAKSWAVVLVAAGVVVIAALRLL